MSLNVAVAGDYPLVVAGLRAVLEPFASRVRLSNADAGDDDRAVVDIVLYDPAADHGGPPLEPRSTRGASTPKLVVFSWLEDPQRVNAAYACGADAQISKELSPEDLVDSLERIHRGERIGMRTSGPASAALDTWPGAEQGLSGRESEILVYICQGLSNQEIAARAYVSVNTVKTYIRSCYRKIGADTRPQAVIWALSHGFAASHDTHEASPAVPD